MNEFVPMDWGMFFNTLSGLIIACAPMIIIVAGVGAIIGSIRTEPWGVSWYPPGTLLGIITVVVGILLVVNL